MGLQLIVTTDPGDGQVAVVAVDDLERLIEHGSFAVRLDAVAELLKAIRVAAAAATPPDDALRESDPVRMEMLAQTIVGVGESARAAAEKLLANDPEDIDGLTLVATLTRLHL